MIEVAIPKDITKYKATLVGPLTTRQTICVSITAVVEILYYYIAKAVFPNLTINTMIGFGVFLAIPIMAFALIEPFGMPLEKYLKNVFMLSVIAPTKRPYKTEGIFQEQKKPPEKKKKRTFSSKELKIHPDYIMYE